MNRLNENRKDISKTIRDTRMTDRMCRLDLCSHAVERLKLTLFGMCLQTEHRESTEWKMQPAHTTCINGVKLHLDRCYRLPSRQWDDFVYSQRKYWKVKSDKSGNMHSHTDPHTQKHTRAVSLQWMQNENLPSFQRQLVQFCRCARPHNSINWFHAHLFRRE